MDNSTEKRLLEKIENNEQSIIMLSELLEKTIKQLDMLTGIVDTMIGDK